MSVGFDEAHLVELQRSCVSILEMQLGLQVCSYLVELATDRGIVDIAVSSDQAHGSEKCPDGLHCVAVKVRLCVDSVDVCDFLAFVRLGYQMPFLYKLRFAAVSLQSASCVPNSRVHGRQTSADDLCLGLRTTKECPRLVRESLPALVHVSTVTYTTRGSMAGCGSRRFVPGDDQRLGDVAALHVYIRVWSRGLVSPSTRGGGQPH